MSDVPSEVIGSWSRRDDGVIVVRAVDGDAPATGHLRVAGAQYGVTTDVEANLALALRFIAIAAEEGAEVVVLPEFGNHVSWYDDREHARRMAVTLDGPFVGAVAAAARERGVWVMVNVVVAQDDGRTTGSNVLCSPDGEVVASSDKQVLMGSERLHLDDAVGLGPVIDTPVARFGMYSCMDGVINETPRGLALRGAQVLLNSLNSFALDEASLHIPVRAPENRVWIVAANKVGPLVPEGTIEIVSQGVGVPPDRLHGAGESQVVAPDGRVVVRGPRVGQAVVVADIDVAEADRKTRPDGTDVYASRRPELYGPLADEPRGRTAPSGADVVTAAVVQGADDDLDLVVALVREALEDGANLVVLPELAGFRDGVVPGDGEPALVAARARAEAVVAALRGVLAGTDAVVVTSLPSPQGPPAHEGVVVAADGVLARQAQLHRTARHPWVEHLGDGVVPVDLPWGRLVVVVGDDAVYPETFRLAALADAEVVALPFALQEAWELETGLVERAAENRVNLVAATRPTGVGASLVADLPSDFTLWGQWQAPFAGVISYPDLLLVPADAAVAVVDVHPAQAANRFVSRGTDLVDGRPWTLLEAIVSPDPSTVGPRVGT